MPHSIGMIPGGRGKGELYRRRRELDRLSHLNPPGATPEVAAGSEAPLASGVPLPLPPSFPGSSLPAGQPPPLQFQPTEPLLGGGFQQPQLDPLQQQPIPGAQTSNFTGLPWWQTMGQSGFPPPQFNFGNFGQVPSQWAGGSQMPWWQTMGQRPYMGGGLFGGGGFGSGGSFGGGGFPFMGDSEQSPSESGTSGALPWWQTQQF